MKWWRAHNGISNDPKLAAVAVRSQNSMSTVLSVWICLLDSASQNEPRGSVNNIHGEDIAAILGLDPQDVCDVIREMRQKGMISEDGMLTNWAKRQPEREREIPDYSTGRVRAFRQRKRTETHETHETTRNATEERRGEESRGEEKSQNLSPTCVGAVGPTFDDWWKLWWNKTAKIEATRAFKIAEKQYGAQFLIEAEIADRKKFEGHKSWEWRSKIHPATWLRGRRWEDELHPEVAATNGHVKQSQSAFLDSIFGKDE